MDVKKILLVSFFLFYNIINAQKVSIGLGFGADGYTIAGQNSNFSLNDGTPAYIEREEVYNPLGGTLELKFEKGKISYGVNVDLVYKEYNVTFDKYLTKVINPILGTFGMDTVQSTSRVPWVRAGINGFIVSSIKFLFFYVKKFLP